MATKTVENKTADYTVTAEDSSKVFTNEGAGGTVVLTLPSAAAGLYYYFAGKNTYLLDIKVQSGDKIIDNLGRQATVGIRTIYPGDTLILVAVDTTNWIALLVNRYYLYGTVGLNGYCGGGSTGSVSNVIDYIVLATTTQNATDTGDLTDARSQGSGLSGASLGFVCGGSGTGNYSNIIDYISKDTLSGNAIDKGDLSVGRSQIGGNGISGVTYGYICNGFTGSGNGVDVIDYISINTTTGNAADTGNTTAVRRFSSCLSGSTSGFICGGLTSVAINIIEYITQGTTTQNSTDTGDLTVARYSPATINGTTYGFIAGGYAATNSNIIDYITLATTTQNATDTGDLTVARAYLTGTSGSTSGFIMGGNTGSASNIIDYITLATTTQNATDTGDLTVARFSNAGI